MALFEVELPAVGDALPKLGPLFVDADVCCEPSADFGAVSMHPTVDKANMAVKQEVVSNRKRIFINIPVEKRRHLARQ